MCKSVSDRSHSVSEHVVSGTEGYAAEAPLLFERYEQFDFSQVHGRVLQFFPEEPSKIVDIGAGTGRDAAHMASLGHQVLAVEPTDELRERAKTIRPSPNLRWLNDSLPKLAGTIRLHETFDVIMITAVWMHLDEGQREVGMNSIAQISHVGTRVFMSLRHGPVPQGRRMFEVSGDETAQLGEENGFKLLFNAHNKSIQKENAAAGVSWTRVVLERV